MLDLNLIRENADKLRSALLKRTYNVDFTELLTWDKERRELLVQSENLKARKNKVSAEIPVLKKQGKDVQPIFDEMKAISEKVKDIDAKVDELENRINEFLSRLPNIPDDDVLPGGKENNRVVRDWSTKPVFDFEPGTHVDLVKMLNLVDYERGVKLGGNGFWIYKGYGALLEWALLY